MSISLLEIQEFIKKQNQTNQEILDKVSKLEKEVEDLKSKSSVIDGGNC